MKTNTFSRVQKTHWSSIRNDRFDWQTKNTFVASQEKRLLETLNQIQGKKLLEVGCGEGPNLTHVKPKFDRFGIDYSSALISFAKKRVKGVTFSCQDATRLNFADNTFDVVFCRDLIHHVKKRAKIVSEMARVCKPNGRVVLIESNGHNPLIFVFSLIHPAEHDVRFITPTYITRLLKPYHIVSFEYREPFSLWRVLFHYRFGLPSLAEYRLIKTAYRLFDSIMHRIVPYHFWGYMVIQLAKDTKKQHTQTETPLGP